MATAENAPDALLALRGAIAANTEPLPTTNADAQSASDVERNLAVATHLQFNHVEGQHISIPLSSPTRFESSSKPVDLRSIFFAWLSKDLAIPEYIAATQRLSDEAVAAGKGEVVNLVFAEKLDLITWLEGASDESEHITPLAAEEQARLAQGAADVAAGTAGGVAVQSTGQPAKGGRTVDPRLREIYNGERRLGDRNTVLRGIKTTDFSHVRKQAEVFLRRNKPSQPAQRAATAITAGSATPGIPQTPNVLVQNRTKPGRRLEPIILLSPSASSLLRMSNIKPFLDNGVYTPPDSASTEANRLQISRLLPSIDAQRPIRFILVDTPEMFKPDYWDRVAAVFTTGQAWQFKSYKWQSPPDLFSHALGIYIGWRGDDVPREVKGWGRGVVSVHIDKYNPHQPSANRWRDREVVESIWTAIEESMRSKGLNKDGALTGGR